MNTFSRLVVSAMETAEEFEIPSTAPEEPAPTLRSNLCNIIKIL